MPGDLRGLTIEEDQVQLTTYGMMAVELSGSNGEVLELSESSTAALSFPITTLTSVPDSMPLWYFDELSGYWKEEGLAIKENSVLKAEVSHFSFWNCDIPFPFVNIKGRVTSEAGIPLANQLVTIRDNGNTTSATGMTNESGIFQGKVPQGVDLSLSIQDCQISTISNIGILEDDTNLGDIVLPNLKVYTLTGTLLNCSLFLQAQTRI